MSTQHNDRLGAANLDLGNTLAGSVDLAAPLVSMKTGGEKRKEAGSSLDVFSRNNGKAGMKNYYRSVEGEVTRAMASGRGAQGGAASVMSNTSAGKFKLSNNGRYYVPDLSDPMAFHESVRLARAKCRGQEKLTNPKKMGRGNPKIKLPVIQRAL